MTNRRGWALRLVIVLLVPCVATGALAAVTYWPYLTRSAVGPPKFPLPGTIEGPAYSEADAANWYEFDRCFVGHTEASITEHFGPPTEHWAGHYGMPPLSVQRLYPEAVTHIYQRPSGQMYLSYCREKEQWVCFSATWLAQGAVF
ncbi:hypothetical protein J8F10_12595 [Gemmata sp. G18]|uniref:Secreted protein n=1 Tax=Gemmata palustris TaxID=2822762 RepID=A0ABS5BQW3_9BACT|nr:hypothetical protein [Gemmata palustris]MBP3956122.1 hypothetical protein [Gemmata palustris]